MADFGTAYNLTMANEGGYVNNPQDPGGETYKGVARNSYPSWAGWKIIDKSKPLKTGAVIKNAELEKYVSDFYYNNFWLTKAKGNKLQNQQLANLVFDSTVNHGKAIPSIVNPAINTALKKAGVNDAVTDTTLTDKAIGYLNSLPAQTYSEIKKQRELYYRSLAGFATFGNGWLARLALFPADIAVSGAAELKKKIFQTVSGVWGSISDGVGFFLFGK